MDKIFLRAHQAATDTLQVNEAYYRDVRRSFHGQFDNGTWIVHPACLEPMPHLTAVELHSIGLTYFNKAQPMAILHDMLHLTSVALEDLRAYEMAENLSDPVLVLERFCPGTHADPGSEKCLSDMKRTLLAWSWFKILVHSLRPCFFLDNFLILQEFFQPTDHPNGDFYRRPTQPTWL